jgi:hypothetical protein
MDRGSFGSVPAGASTIACQRVRRSSFRCALEQTVEKFSKHVHIGHGRFVHPANLARTRKPQQFLVLDWVLSPALLCLTA